MLTYNGIPFPYTIRTDRIISAFSNPVDPILVESYVWKLAESNPPAIMGYPTIIDWEEHGEHFMTGEEITEEHDGELAWYVTDGHHRTCAAIEAGVLTIDVEPDSTAFTLESELEAYWKGDQCGRRT